MNTRVFLEENRNKKAVNTSSGLKVGMVGSKKLLPNTDFIANVSEFEQYKEERAKSTKFRLTFQVNPICTNVLHNRITEIVKDEGSSNVKFINYMSDQFNNNEENLLPKGEEFYYRKPPRLDYISTNEGGGVSLQAAVGEHSTNAIRDTSPSNYGYIYHCGTDIFNNHLLRSKTFKAVCYDKDNGLTDYFNTIGDMMRSYNGNGVTENITFPSSAGVPKNYKTVKLHLYEYDDVFTYEDCLNTKLRTTFNGWVGFNNVSKIKTYSGKTDDPLNIERPIMYMNSGDFIDMYPSRDLYSFIPKYNRFKHRIEKNWNYCLTYPSSSTTRGFSDIIDSRINSLKVLFFSEKTVSDNGTEQIVMFSVAKHGLKVGDIVNVYNKRDKVLDSAKVTAIADEHTFVLFKPSIDISTEWYTLDEMESKLEYRLSPDGRAYYGDDGNKYYIWGEYVNLDPNAQDISYKKVVNGIECEYYVRIFSRIPNFKYAEEPTNSENDIYKDDAAVLKKYQTLEYDFASQVSNLAFAKNVYSDDVAQIVYTDDIDLANLKDNLGRPLTSIYLTIVKNNKGYKQWYGIDATHWNVSSINDGDVEYSHCFGSVSCGFETNYETEGELLVNNIHTMTNINMPYGYDMTYINDEDGLNKREVINGNNGAVYDIENSEVWFDSDTNFYGDLVCHDLFYAKEDVLQPILHRFNTAQRESIIGASSNFYKGFNYDEIANDDFDSGDKYILNTHPFSDIGGKKCNSLSEGYYYKPHYEIKVRSEGGLNSVMPDFLPIRTMVSTSSGTRFNVSVYPYLSVGDKCMMFDNVTKKLYYCKVIMSDANNLKTFTCDIYNEDGTLADDICDIAQGSSDKEKLRYKLFKIDNLDIPSYARPMTDGSCRMIWRDIVNNGSGNFIEGVEYPFTNGAFYINIGINLFVRRQDPDGIYGLYSDDDIGGEALNYDEEDTYYTEENITC